MNMVVCLILSLKLYQENLYLLKMDMYGMNFTLQHLAELCMIPLDDMHLFKNFDSGLKSVEQKLAGAKLSGLNCVGTEVC